MAHQASATFNARYTIEAMTESITSTIAGKLP